MARKYRRDARGRFASGGYQGQTGGRGARLKSGGNVRAGGGAKVKAAGVRGTVRKPAGLKPGAITARKAQQAAAKPVAPAKATRKPAATGAPKGRQIDAAKVERILGRLNADSSRPATFDRKGTVKMRNARETRIRAMTYVAKAAGGKNVKVSSGRVRADYGNQTRDQMISQAAAKLSKPTRRSTLKSGSNVVADRQAIRKAAAQSAADSRSGKGVYGMHGRTVSAGRRASLRAVPKEPQAEPQYAGALKIYTPKPKPQAYSFEKITIRKRNPSLKATVAPDGKSWVERSTVTFSGRKTFRTRKQATAAQASRRRGVGRLAGTARLGNPTTSISRGKARQSTLTGGTATTYGRFRFAGQRGRR